MRHKLSKHGHDFLSLPQALNSSHLQLNGCSLDIHDSCSTLPLRNDSFLRSNTIANSLSIGRIRSRKPKQLGDFRYVGMCAAFAICAFPCSQPISIKRTLPRAGLVSSVPVVATTHREQSSRASHSSDNMSSASTICTPISGKITII